jgi:F-type H+-transporting ATPase subunit alpha
MDELPVEDVRRFESELLDYVRNGHPDLIEMIAKGKDLSDDVKAKLKTVLTQFSERFAPSVTA